MEELYNSGVAWLEDLFYPALDFFANLPAYIVDTDVFSGLAVVYSWFVIFWELFPIYVTLALVVFIVSGLVNLILRAVKLLWAVLPWL